MATMTERSVDNLQRLYTIVVGLALAEAVARFILGPGWRDQGATRTAELFQIEYLPTMIAFLVTLVPFYHGANRYLDATYVAKGQSPKPLALLIDFLVLFLEAIVFFVMALRLNEWQVFFSVFIWLLCIDIIWIAFVYLYSGTFKDVWKWGAINLVALGVTYVLRYTELLPADPQQKALVTAAVLRTIADYGFNWRFFHPSE